MAASISVGRKVIPPADQLFGVEPNPLPVWAPTPPGQDLIVQLPRGWWGRRAMQNICRQIGQRWFAKTFYFRLTALGVAAVITSPWSPSSQGEARVGVNGP